MEVDAIMNLGDKDGDGEIDLEEFLELMTPAASVTLSKIRMDIKSIDEVKSLFKAIDVDGDGVLDMGEFIAIMYPAASEAVAKLSGKYPAIDEDGTPLPNLYLNLGKVKELFKKIDFDNDGSITKQEMMDSCIRFTKQEVDAIFALGDINDA